MAYQVVLNPFTGELQLVNQASSSSGVTSLNSLTGALTLVGGTNVSVVSSGGNTLTINFTGSGSGNVTGIPPTDIDAIARWANTTGTEIKNSPNTYIQDSGAIEAQAYISMRDITGLVTVNSDETWISPAIELSPTGAIIIDSNASIIMV